MDFAHAALKHVPDYSPMLLVFKNFNVCGQAKFRKKII